MCAPHPGGFVLTGSVEIIAHRGYSARAPENTLAALDAAIAAGADAVEFDLHTAGDGIPVLFHDAMLSRTTNGVGPVRRRTLEQLNRLDAGTWFGEEFEGERIPSFQEALEHVGERVGRIYAEVKGYRELEDVDRMVQIVGEADTVERTVFVAMKWALLDRMRNRRPDLLIGYIVEDASSADEALERAEGDARALLDFNAEVLLSDPSLAERAGTAGIELATWTVDDPESATRLADMGVPRITTNEVETMLDWKRAR